MIYVDSARIPYRGMKMNHMLADTLEELHAMADRLGLKREWFQGPPKHSIPHYDICDSYRRRAIALGAQSIGRKELGHLIKRLRSTTPPAPPATMEGTT